FPTTAPPSAPLAAPMASPAPVFPAWLPIIAPRPAPSAVPVTAPVVVLLTGPEHDTTVSAPSATNPNWSGFIRNISETQQNSPALKLDIRALGRRRTRCGPSAPKLIDG